MFLVRPGLNFDLIGRLDPSHEWSEAHAEVELLRAVRRRLRIWHGQRKVDQGLQIGRITHVELVAPRARALCARGTAAASTRGVVGAVPYPARDDQMYRLRWWTRR